MESSERATRRLKSMLQSGAHAVATKAWIGLDGPGSLDASVWKKEERWECLIEKYLDKYIEVADLWERDELLHFQSFEELASYLQTEHGFTSAEFRIRRR